MADLRKKFIKDRDILMERVLETSLGRKTYDFIRVDVALADFFGVLSNYYEDFQLQGGEVLIDLSKDDIKIVICAMIEKAVEEFIQEELSCSND